VMHVGANAIDNPAASGAIVRQSRKEDREKKNCHFITFNFYVLSVEYPRALSSSI
jgi:hypothetical protein